VSLCRTLVSVPCAVVRKRRATPCCSADGASRCSYAYKASTRRRRGGAATSTTGGARPSGSLVPSSPTMLPGARSRPCPYLAASPEDPLVAGLGLAWRRGLWSDGGSPSKGAQACRSLPPSAVGLEGGRADVSAPPARRSR
jgi:hypothetical protein